jgi:hypothetical protein
MSSTPAASSARRIARSLAVVSDVAASATGWGVARGAELLRGVLRRKAVGAEAR